MKNKEIEEILKYLKNEFYISGEFYTEEKIKVLSKKELELLLSYIEQLEEFKKEHLIMKQILIEHGLYERLLNDDRFIKYLKEDDSDE